MYQQITPTFEPTEKNLSEEKLWHHFITTNNIKPDYTKYNQYKQMMSYSQNLTGVLLEKHMDINHICKVVKLYTKICIEIIKEDDNGKLLNAFTPESYIEKIKDGFFTVK